jgi:spore maturation protein SpmB
MENVIINLMKRFHDIKIKSLRLYLNSNIKMEVIYAVNEILIVKIKYVFAKNETFPKFLGDNV